MASRITDAARRRVNRRLGDLKGETLEALETVKKETQAALDLLRKADADVCLPGRSINALHAAHTGLGRVFSAQSQARGFRDVLRIIEE